MAPPRKRTADQTPLAPRKERRFNLHAQDRENFRPGVRRQLGFNQAAGNRGQQHRGRLLPFAELPEHFQNVVQVDPKKADQAAADESQKFMRLAVAACQANRKLADEIGEQGPLQGGVNFFVMPQHPNEHPNTEASEDNCPMDVSPGK